MPLTPAQVKQLMQDKAAGSLLGAAEVLKLKFRPMTAEQVKQAGYEPAFAGFAIPYFTVDGKVSKFERLRYVEDTRKSFDKLSGKKSLRYMQLRGTVNEAYLPPLMDWKAYLANDKPIVITEGELKAACATKLGIPTIGLGGVWCFKSNRKGKALIDGLADIDWGGRTALICYDSDAITNPDVVAAENKLAETLAAAGALVQVVRLPTDGPKVGLDDYLLDHTPQQFAELVKTASTYSTSYALHTMSERVVYVRNPGLVYDYSNGLRMGPSHFTQHFYSNAWHTETTTAGKTLQIQTAKKWLDWPYRTELKELVFEPGQAKTFDGVLNLWDGWPYEPNKGDVGMWKQLLDWLFKDSADPGARKWFEQWCAYPIQNPGAKMTSAVLFWSVVEGSGKSMVGYTLMRLYGRYATEIKDADLLANDFAWAENKQFVLADEITGRDNRDFRKRLQSMITQKELHINIKYVPKYSIRDCINYIFTSNDCDAFYMSDTDRRFFIQHVIEEVMSKEFRDAYTKWRDSDEGMAALMYYLRHVDLSDFDPFAPAYYTQDKKQMILMGKSDLAHWIIDLREDPDRFTNGLTGDLFTAAELKTLYDPHNSGKVTANGMARALTAAGIKPPGNGAMTITKFGNVRLYAIKNGSFWRKQKTKDIVNHYEANRLMLPPKTKVKKY